MRKLSSFPELLSIPPFNYRRIQGFHLILHWVDFLIWVFKGILLGHWWRVLMLIMRAWFFLVFFILLLNWCLRRIFNINITSHSWRVPALLLVPLLDWHRKWYSSTFEEVKLWLQSVNMKTKFWQHQIDLKSGKYLALKTHFFVLFRLDDVFS